MFFKLIYFYNHCIKIWKEVIKWSFSFIHKAFIKEFSKISFDGSFKAILVKIIYVFRISIVILLDQFRLFTKFFNNCFFICSFVKSIVVFADFELWSENNKSLWKLSGFFLVSFLLLSIVPILSSITSVGNELIWIVDYIETGLGVFPHCWVRHYSVCFALILAF